MKISATLALLVSSATAFKGLRLRSAATLARAAQVDGSGGTLNDQILYQLNILRQAHGLNTVVWNDELAVDMQAWADSCPQKDGGGHGGPVGNQNLASFVPCDDDCKRQEGPSWGWYTEVLLWNYETDSCGTGDWMDCGHFSNSMSAAVTSIACGSSTCYNPNINGNDSLVWCNYVDAQIPPAIPRTNIEYEEIKASLTAGFA
ncbi:Aste57867_4662 [Aphanomyces stellatus]|uniref:Aste57867_4662 protein n=1 Tax=Aphanomyces stellatus TaxID=120398 RepID=A0A485KGY6_9STRA|nr:hypothetical protein As57867_004649 [Aphanomyces stellatus]VFT81765.1 Aste57867_4662 [Aphanomyces stellatus]